jgi:hypothetical protein
LAATGNSLLASIKEHKEEVGVTIDNLRQEVSKSIEYTDSKFSTVSRDIQDIKRLSTAEISKLSSTSGVLQVKLIPK